MDCNRGLKVKVLLTESVTTLKSFQYMYIAVYPLIPKM